MVESKASMDIGYNSSAATKMVDWLRYPYIPYGRITIIQADPGEGQTTSVLSIAALTSTARPMPDRDAHSLIQNVIS